MVFWDAIYVPQLIEEYYDNLMDKYKDGKMEREDFKKTFHMAFPSRSQGTHPSINFCCSLLFLF